MKTNQSWLLVAGLCLGLLCAAQTSQAEIRPSFDLHHSTWHATHVLVVSEGDAVDGKVWVEDVLKGDFAPGQTLAIPHLAVFADEEARTYDPLMSLDLEGSSFVVSAQKMLAFLIDAAPEAAEGEPVDGTRWRPASLGEVVETSVVWIESTETYAYIQVINPGPSTMTRQSLSEEGIRAKVSEVLEIQEEIRTIAGEVDPAERAQRIAEHIRPHTPYYVRDEALRILVECGAAAAPIFRELLAQESDSSSYHYGVLVDAIDDSGNRELERELIQILESESG